MSTTTTTAEAPVEYRKPDGHQRHDSGNPSQSTWNLDEQGRFRAFPWDVSTLLLPEHIGKATTSVSLQKATKIKYGAMVATGLAMFYFSSSATLRTAGLSLLFPGAGFLAVGGIGGVIGFALAIAFIPVALFAWFGAGGLAFPLGDWLISGVVATWLADSSVVESSPIIALGLIAVVWTYLVTRTEYEEQAESAKMYRRNRTLIDADKEWKLSSDPAGPPGSRELTLEQLRYMQRIVDLALKDFDDWEGFTDIDQFQTAALRYQLYDLVYSLSTWTTAYAPVSVCSCIVNSVHAARRSDGRSVTDCCPTTELPRIPRRRHAQCDRKVADPKGDELLEMGKPLGKLHDREMAMFLKLRAVLIRSRTGTQS